MHNNVTLVHDKYLRGVSFSLFLSFSVSLLSMVLSPASSFSGPPSFGVSIYTLLHIAQTLTSLACTFSWGSLTSTCSRPSRTNSGTIQFSWNRRTWPFSFLHRPSLDWPLAESSSWGGWPCWITLQKSSTGLSAGATTTIYRLINKIDTVVSEIIRVTMSTMSPFPGVRSWKQHRAKA